MRACIAYLCLYSVTTAYDYSLKLPFRSDNVALSRGIETISLAQDHQDAKKALYLLFSKSSEDNCAREAIKDLLPNCDLLANEKKRLEYAVKLSICELRTAAVSYPRSCDETYHNVNRFPNECTADLETRPQWWTTFSGNYRLVGQICLEFRGDSDKDELVSLYSNITDIQQILFGKLSEAVVQMDLEREYANSTLSAFVSILEMFQEVTAVFDNLILRHDEVIDQWDERTQRAANGLLKLSSDMGSLWNKVRLLNSMTCLVHSMLTILCVCFFRIRT
jgi:hypothetical protein